MPRKTLTPRFIPLDADEVDTDKTQFEKHLKATLSPATASTYLYGVNSLHKWINEGDLMAVDESTINEYLIALRESGLKSTTVVTYWTGLRSFYKWATERGKISTNPMVNVPKPKMDEILIPNIPMDAIGKLMNTCNPTTFNGIRDRAIMAVLFSTGMRRSELVGMTVDNYDRKNHQLILFGKGGRYRVVLIDEATRPILNRYLTARKMHGLAETTNAMWLGRFGGMTGTGIIQLLNRRKRDAGLPADMKINPHAWRHTYAHTYLDNGGSVDALMANAGWRRMTMVERYAKADREKRALRESERLNIGSLVAGL